MMSSEPHKRICQKLGFSDKSSIINQLSKCKEKGIHPVYTLFSIGDSCLNDYNDDIELYLKAK